MDPATLIGLASGTLSLLKTMGIIKSSADRIGAETDSRVRALMRNDFNAGLSNLELAAHTDSAGERLLATTRALDHLRVAESQEGLPRHVNGLAAALLASFALRDGDLGAARLWSDKAVAHYDEAFRGLDRAAQRSVRLVRERPLWKRAGAAGAAGAGVAAGLGAGLGATVLGPVAPVVLLGLPQALRAMARRASTAVPSDEWLAELGQQGEAVHAVARTLGRDTSDNAVGLLLVRQGGLITDSRLVLAGSSAA